MSEEESSWNVVEVEIETRSGAGDHLKSLLKKSMIERIVVGARFRVSGQRLRIILYRSVLLPLPTVEVPF